MGSNYLYNGVGPLPDVNTVYTPELQKTHPYAVITYDDSTTLTQIYIRAFSEPIVQVDSNKRGYFDSGSASQTNYRYLHGTDQGWWGPNYATNTAFNCTHVAWANFDIYNSDGTLYLAASDPIPVGSALDPIALTMGIVGRIVKGLRGK